MFDLYATLDAIRIIKTARLNTEVLDSDSVWKFLYHAGERLEKEVADFLRSSN